MIEELSQKHVSYEEAARMIDEVYRGVDEIIEHPADYRPSEVATLINSYGAALTTVRLDAMPHILPAQQASLARRVIPLLDRMKAVQDLLVEPHRVMIDERMSMVIDTDLPPS